MVKGKLKMAEERNVFTVKNVKKWLSLKKNMDLYKEAELELRNSFCSNILGNHKKGVKHHLFNIFKLSATAKLNNKIDQGELKTLWSSLNPIEKACVKFKPEIIAKEYDKLPEDSPLRRVVTTKPGTPSFAIKEIPVKK